MSLRELEAKPCWSRALRLRIACAACSNAMQGHPKFGTGPKKVYCLMDNRVNKGGWMGVLKTWYTGRSDVSENGDRGNVDEWLNIRSSRYMLGAGFVRHIIGESNEFDIMGAQNGYLPSYSTGNYE